MRTRPPKPVNRVTGEIGMKYPQITMLFSAYDAFRDSCRSTSVMETNGVSISGWPDGPLHEMTLDDGVVMKVGLPNGSIKAVGMNSPLGRLDRYIHTTRRPDRTLESLQAHTFHLSCWYDTYRGDGVAATLDMFRLAEMFAPLGLLGVVHGNAQQCFDTTSLSEVLREVVDGSPEACHERLINVCPLHIHDVTYYVSRGARELGSQNVALVDGADRPEAQMTSLLFQVLTHLRQGSALKTGERVTLGDVELESLPLLDYSEYIRADEADDVLLLRPCS